MENLRDDLDILEIMSLSESDQRDLAHMVMNNMDADLEEWAQLREIDSGKLKKWLRSGALAAALAASGIGAAQAQQYQHGGNFNSPQVQQQMQRQGGGVDQEELWRQRQRQQQMQQPGQQQRGAEQPRMQEPRRDQPQWQEPRRDQPRWQEPRRDEPQNWERGGDGYRRWQMDRERAGEWARQRGGWMERPRWHMENPWAMIQIQPPEDVLYFRDNGQDIMFIPHPRRIDLIRAREMGGVIDTISVPGWPFPIRAFVYEMDGVTYITALPGQLD